MLNFLNSWNINSIGKNIGIILERLGKLAIPALVDNLHDFREYIKEFVLDELGNIGDDSVVADIILLLDDMSWFVQRKAAEALERLGTPEALEAAERWREQNSNQD